MATLEVFFDYNCPFCLKGHKILTELIPLYPNIEIEWRPCEAHPRPESYGLHSDLCAIGMFYAKEHNIDLMEYHHRMYSASLTQKLNIEDIHTITGLISDLLDSKLFYGVLADGFYVDKLLDNNTLAWETYQFQAVPSYHMNGKLLKSIAGIGITKQRLVEFLDENN